MLRSLQLVEIQPEAVETVLHKVLEAGQVHRAERLLRLLRGTQQALAIAFALLVCFAVMFIVATAVAMTIGKGGV